MDDYENIIVSIDLGLKGAIAYFVNNEFREVISMPLFKGDLDIKEYYHILDFNDYRNVTYVIESVKINFMGGKKQIASSAKQLGLFEGFMTAMKTKWIGVLPSEWQKYCWKGITPIKDSKGKNDTKSTSWLAFQRLFPDRIDLVKTKTKQGFDDGKVDAILLGYYATKNL